MKYDLTRDDYEKFIKDLRGTVKDPKRTCRGKPVLPPPPQKPARAKYIDIELRAKSSIPVTVRIRHHDVYLVGYQMQNGKWYEFRRDDGKRLIPGSQFLSFGENYSDMGGLGNLKRVGYQELNNAIINLAGGSGLSSSALRVLAVMISESARFDKLLNNFAEQVRGYSDTKFEGWMVTLIHGWADLSYRLLRVDGRGIDFGLPDEETSGRHNALTTDPKLGIVTADDAAACLGLLLGRYLPPGYLPRRRRFTDDIQLIKGQPLVEVYSVGIYNNIYSRYPINIYGKYTDINLYGKITVSDGLGSFDLYNRARDDYESIHPNDIACLTGPYRSISLCRFFTFNLDLQHRDANDIEVGKGSFSLDIFYLSPTDSYYGNCFLFKELDGKDGFYALVQYAIFDDAVQAKVDVMLINGDGEDPVDVYGTLYARHIKDPDRYQKKYCQTRLFHRPSSEYIEIRCGRSIPLSRYMVAVPTTSFLIIEADLWDHDTISRDDEIAKGVATFRPKTHGTFDSADITGTDGSVRVTVTWSALSGG